MLEYAAIAIPEAMPVIFEGWRRDGWVAEARVPFSIGRSACGDIAPCRLNAVMEALTGNFGPRRRRRRRIVGDGLRMGTGCQGNRQEQCG
jgi:hypothetical protein